MIQFVVNLLWFVLFGFVEALLWLVLSLIFFVSVVGIPFGFAGLRIASFTAWPFGRDLIDAHLVGEERILGSTLMNILWIVLAGFWLALSHAILGIGFCLTIIGIPFGLAHFKLARISFAPLGKRIVPNEVSSAAYRREADDYIARRKAS